MSADGAHLRQFFAGRYRKLALIATFSICAGLAEAGFLVLVTQIGFGLAQGVDRIDVGFGISIVLGVAFGAAAGAIALRVALATAAAWQAADLSASMTGAMRRALSSAYIESDFEAQHGQRPGRLQELLTTFTGQGATLAQSTTLAIKSGFSLAALLLAAVMIDALASIIVLILLAVLGLLLRPLRLMIKRRARETSQHGMRFATALGEMSQIGLEMQIFGVQEQVATSIEDLIASSETARRRLHFVKSLLPIIYTALAFVALVAVLGVISTFESPNLAALGAVVIVMLRSLSYGQTLQSSIADINATRPFIDEYQAELERFESAKTVDQGTVVDHIAKIELRRVCFEYVPGKPVLRELTFEIGQGEVIGIVGPSGSGKSTLVQLLLGLRLPTSGTILADARDIRTLSRSEWVRTVTFVPQQPTLIAGTIAHNIRFMRPDISDEQVERAARQANLHDDVTGFAEGYDRQVGEMGSHLSGGQQQRLVIARALVEDPDLLVLDEPTSALDVRSEHLIRQTLLQLRGRMNIVIIAHRLSTLHDCDRIMVIQDGELKGFGTARELEESSDFYREAVLLSGLA